MSNIGKKSIITFSLVQETQLGGCMVYHKNQAIAWNKEIQFDGLVGEEHLY